MYPCLEFQVRLWIWSIADGRKHHDASNLENIALACTFQSTCGTHRRDGVVRQCPAQYYTSDTLAGTQNVTQHIKPVVPESIEVANFIQRGEQCCVLCLFSHVVVSPTVFSITSSRLWFRIILHFITFTWCFGITWQFDQNTQNMTTKPHSEFGFHVG